MYVGAMLPAGERLLRADGLVVGYDGPPILPPLSATIGAGELWAVIGPNGAGKSTFVRTALGLVDRSAAWSSASPALRLAYVPQQSALDAIFPISVIDFVLMGLQGRGNVIAVAGRQRRWPTRAPRWTRRARARSSAASCATCRAASASAC